VKAVVDGHQMLQQLTIAPEAFQQGDASLLEDLILTAVGEAQKASKDAYAQSMSKITGGVNLPLFGG
jgi:DNA-binding protein YbaB